MSERIEIEGDTVTLQPEGGRPRRVPLREFLALLGERLVHGQRPEPFFDGVRFRVDAGDVTILILELLPAIRPIHWAKGDTPESLFDLEQYTVRGLATPYVVLKVPFLKGELQHSCELFYRTRPLEKVTDALFWSNLRNVTPDSYGCKAWLCTVGLRLEIANAIQERPERALSMREQVDLLIGHLWGGGFNASSDIHEGNSCFAQAVKDEIDPRISDIDAWERASREDFRFALDVAWKPTDETVEALIERQLARFRIPTAIEDTATLIGELIARPRGSRKRKTA